MRGDTRDLEFIEIYNSLPWAEDLTGYRLSGEIDYAFPPEAIPALGRIVVAASPADMLAVHGVSALGPYAGHLKDSGGTLPVCAMKQMAFVSK